MTTESRQAKTHAGNKDAAPATNEPIIISMGKKTRKQVRKLTKGKPGRLMERVEEAIDRLTLRDLVYTGVLEPPKGMKVSRVDVIVRLANAS